MISIFINLILLYSFIAMGFWAKKTFEEQVDQKSFVLVYIYFLMPVIMVWSIMTRPIDWLLIRVPVMYLGVMLLAYGIAWLASYSFSDDKDRAIAKITGLVGNTGNMGIPLGLALWGVQSVPYTAMINLFNAIFVMTIGAYTYSRGQHSIQKSIMNVIKLPMIWATVFALGLQYFEVSLSQDVHFFLEMGAYTGLSIQLIIFGMFLATVKVQFQYPQLTALTMGLKFVILPLLGLLVSYVVGFSPMITQIMVLQCVVPIAVNNVNLAALYDCDAPKVAWLSFISVVIALILIPLVLSGM